MAIKLADPRAETPGESVTRVQFYRYGIPMPELQYHVIDSHGVLVGIADFHWDEHRHLGEFDGKVKYQKLLRPGESASECVIREKKREDAMRADFRGMSRFIWSEVMPHRARRRWLIWPGLLTSRIGYTYAVAPSLPADSPSSQLKRSAGTRSSELIGEHRLGSA
jgi:hypothetical protein